MNRNSGTRPRGCCGSVPPALPQARSDRLAEIFRAAGDPTRLQMLYMLQEASDPICVCDFTAAFGVSQPTVSHHLGKLKAAGLVQAQRHGVWTYYTLPSDPPPEVRALLDSLRS